MTAFTEEHKRRISEALKSRVISEHARLLISASRKGKRHTEETKAKMSQARAGAGNIMYGKKHTPETRKKMSE